MTADRDVIRADGYDLSFITVSAADMGRSIVPSAKSPLSVSITGPGELVATDNGDPEDDQSLVRLLVSSGEFDIEGLTYVTSCWRTTQTSVDAFGSFLKPDVGI